MRGILFATLCSAGLLCMAGCRVGFEPQSVPTDADPFAPDADPFAPDADPFAPDADPGAGTSLVLGVGWNHTCAAVDGALKCWGAGLAGQLGDGLLVSSRDPVEVTIPGAVTAITASRQHTCAVAGGNAYCWGLGIYGKLGNGDDQDRPMPELVIGLPTGQVTAISAYRFGTCAVAAGQAYCWGLNNQGQVGVNTNQSEVHSPALVANLPSPVTNLSSADDHACAVVAGLGHCWGNGNKDELGTGGSPGWQHDPVTVTTNLTMITTGTVHSCGLVNGSVLCWGQGGNGELGNGLFTDSAIAVKCQGLDQGVTQVAAATGKIGNDDIDSTCAIQAGQVLCWGRNDEGQLGNQMQSNSATPVAVQGLTGTPTSISGGLGHFCATTDAPALQCWGLNDNGQLGDGSNSSSLTPVTVPLW